jgi:glycoprotease/Kae1 family metallohydrolase
MRLLAIESTAHTLGAAILDYQGRGERASLANTQILANETDKYPSTLEGYIPWKLADHHAEVFPTLLQRALQKAKTKIESVDAVAYSQGPGLGHSLHVGHVAARSLAELLGVPFIPVNHTVAHAEVGRWQNDAWDPLVIYVSGGNTQIAALEPYGKAKRFHVYGETMDMGLGNFLDVLGRELQLKPPDAVGVLTRAAEGKRLLDLPYTVKGMSMTFTGLQTACNKLKGGASIEDLCYSAQETAFAMLVEATERALAHTRKREVLLCGGNARNRRLQEMLRLMSEEHKARFCVTSFEHSGDAGGMIGIAGLQMLLAKAVPKDTAPRQKMRLDSDDIAW